jgi:hypothetical protein
MKRPAYIGVLLLGALVAFLLVQWLSTRPVQAPALDAKTSASNNTFQLDLSACSESSDSEHPDRAATEDPGEPEIVSQTPNDPRTGWIRLRVLDEAERPLANAECTLFDLSYSTVDEVSDRVTDRIYFNQPLDLPYGSGLASRARTDEKGELKLGLAFWDDEDNYCKPADATAFPGDCLYPLPTGYAPVTPALELVIALVAAWAKPPTEPLIVRVKPMGVIHGRVVDPGGHGVAGVRVRTAVDTDLTWAAGLFNARGGPPYQFATLAEGLGNAECIAHSLAAPAMLVSEERQTIDFELEDFREWLPDHSPPLVTGGDGSFSFPACEGLWRLASAGGGYSPSAAEVRHAGGDSIVVITVTARLCTLKLDVELLAHLTEEWRKEYEDEDAAGHLEVNVGAVPPWYAKTDFGGEWHLTWKGIIDTKDATSIELELAGLPAIWLVAEVYWRGVWVTRHVLIPPGEREELRLQVGIGYVEVGPHAGRAATDSLYVETPPSLVFDWVNSSEEDKFRAEMAPGSYIGHLAGHAPLPFTIRHGETTQLKFEPLAGKVCEFELADGLAALLGGSPKLSLMVQNEGAARNVHELDQRGLEDLISGDLLNRNFDAGRLRFSLIPAVYVWVLRGSTELAGSVDLRHSDGVVQFREDALPGLGRLDVVLNGAQPDSVRFAAPPTAYAGLIKGAPQTEVTAGGKLVADAGSLILWAPGGELALDVGGLKLSARVPGRLQLPNRTDKIALSVIDDIGEYKLWMSIDAFHRDTGCKFSADDPHDLERKQGEPFSLDVVTGDYLILVSVPDGRAFEWRGQLDAATTLRLSELPEQRTRGVYFNLSVPTPTGSSQGLPDQAALRRLSLIQPMLFRLEGSDALILRPLTDFAAGWGTSHIEWGARAAGYNGVLPGRYRFEAWPGAPEKYCREFDVADSDLEIEILLD